MGEDRGICSRCGKAFLPSGNLAVCPECQSLMEAGLNEVTMTLWEESLVPGMTSEDSIRSSGWKSQSETLPVPRSRSLSDPGEEKSDIVDFEIRNKLGAGGMGVVYTARQTSINRDVALKMVKPEHTGSKSAAEALMSEAVVTGCLDHPNVVPVYDLGVDDEGRLFYAMKEVEGFPWSVLIGEKSLDENLDILLRVADTIAFAHAKGILHRDLKPQNIMLGSFGEIMVMDWGAACTLGGSNVVGLLPSNTAYCGTPAYMAPEMAKADKNRFGESSDVYLFGAILYQVLTGRPPRCEKDPLLCLAAAARNQIDPVEEDGELLRIVLKAMADAPADRFQSVEEFQQVIREYRTHSESLALLASAKDSLGKAKSDVDYELFNRAIYGFREALVMWEGNLEAQLLLDTATVEYAQCAIGRHDFDLAKSILDKDKPQHVGLLKEIEGAVAERDFRKKRVHRLLVTARILLSITALVFGVAFFMIRAEQKETEIQRREAVSQKLKASVEHRQSLVNLISAHYGEQNYEAAVATFWQLHDQYGMEDLDEETLLGVRVSAAMNPWRGSVETGITKALKILPCATGECVWVVGKEGMRKIKLNAEPGYDLDRMVSIHDFSFGKLKSMGVVVDQISFPVSLDSGEAVHLSAEGIVWIGDGSKVLRYGFETGEWTEVLDVASLEFDPLHESYNLPEDKRREFLEWMVAEGRNHPISGLRITRDGSHAAIALGTGVVCWIDLARKKCEGWFNINMGCYLKPSRDGGKPLLDFSPDERMLVYREGKGSTHAFVFELGGFTHKYYCYAKDYAIPSVRFAHNNRFFAFTQECILFSPSDEAFDNFGPFVLDEDSGRWDIGQWQLRRAGFKNCRRAAFSGKGKRFCAFLDDGSLFVGSSVEGGFELHRKIIDRRPVDCAMTDSGLVLMLSGDGKIGTYNMDAYAVRHIPLNGKAISIDSGSGPDSFLVLTSTGTKTNILNEIPCQTERFDSFRIVARHIGNKVRADINGRYAAIGSNTGGSVFNLQSGTPVFSYTNASYTAGLAFDDSGEYLACGGGGWDRSLAVYRTDDGSQIALIATNFYTDAIFSSSATDTELVVTRPTKRNRIICYKVDGKGAGIEERWNMPTGAAPVGIIPFKDPTTGERKIWCKTWFQDFQLYDADTGKMTTYHDYWKQSGLGWAEFITRDPRVAFQLEGAGFEMAMKSDLYPVFDPRTVQQHVTELAFNSDASVLAMISAGDLMLMNLSSEIRETFIPKNTPVHFVSKTGCEIWPYTSWFTAARSIASVFSVAGSGDTILVDDGYYRMDETIVPHTSVVLKSRNGPAVTVLDGGGGVLLFNFVNLKNPASLEGFTLTGGLGKYGGAIQVGDCSQMLISNCIFRGNSTQHCGGGIRINIRERCNVDLVDCDIVDNASPERGGGISIFNHGGTGEVRIAHCIISGNISKLRGGGIDNALKSGATGITKLEIDDCRISQNQALSGKGGGIYLSGLEESCVIQHTVFSGNQAGGATNDVIGGTLIDCTMDGEPLPTLGK